MTFNFKYKSVILKSGSKIYRPIIPMVIKAKESFDVLGILDSGSDITIIPKEIADAIGIEYINDNSISGISGVALSAKEGKIFVEFGKKREIYNFEIPVLIPTDKENLSVIIGRAGFFNEFKITFDEFNKKIEFKKILNIF